MKRIIILLTISIIAISTVIYVSYQYKFKKSEMLLNNSKYDTLLNKEISATELASLMNSTINKNYANNISKDSNEIYIDNNKDSINIEIKFKQSNEKIQEEKIVKNDISKFIQYYSDVNFKCTKIEYHDETKYVKYLLFEEV